MPGLASWLNTSCDQRASGLSSSFASSSSDTSSSSDIRVTSGSETRYTLCWSLPRPTWPPSHRSITITGTGAMAHRPGRPAARRGRQNVIVAESWMIDELAYAGPEHLDAAFVAGFDRKQGYPDPAEDLDALAEQGLGAD